jgi:hypothetical protein
MRKSASILLMSLLLVLAGAPAAQAQPPSVRSAAPPWGACGTSTDPNKVVRLFVADRTRDCVLRCGGPKYSSSPTWG